ncbi:MAG: TIM-barrel domain-containing protein [Acidobacteriota bacterium]
MKAKILIVLAILLISVGVLYSQNGDGIKLPSQDLSAAFGERALTVGGLFYETAAGRTTFSGDLAGKADKRGAVNFSKTMADGRAIAVSITPRGSIFDISLTATPATGITKWGLTIDAAAKEYYTGLMERVVDGPQQASWAPDIKEAMNLRGQKVEMIIKPTTSIYAPFYISSRGYGVFVQGDWPGYFDVAAGDPGRIRIEFEGPRFELKIYMAKTPVEIVKAHSVDAGLPVLPPKWMFSPWRWRDEHTQRAAYYDGTPVTQPFNSEVMEDVLLMKAYGIPNGVYWIDRPWGPGKMGYDDFDIDSKRLPHFEAMVKWLESQNTKTVLWIAPFFQGKMSDEGTQKGYTLADQVRPASGNNFPMVDLSNPDAEAYWQAGIEKLLKLGVAGFKLDRGEENIPDDGPHKIFDGRTIRENRNAYTPMYVKAVYDIAKKYRGDDFVLMPRAAYTGTAQYAANWGGDIGGTQEGLRASIIAVQRSAVMGYSNWGSDTCGYNQQLLEQEVCGRWLGFSAFTPIMEVGPTKNVAFWNMPREPKYDATLIAIWRLYARLHQRLVDYSHASAEEAHRTGMPVVRPLFLVDPKAQAAWDNWWTYEYGPDIVVSPIWEKGVTEQDVYLPSGSKWTNAWDGKAYNGGQTVKIKVDFHQIPIFTRVGSNVDLGDLNKDWNESVEIAQKRPDLKTLETDVKRWFGAFQKTGSGLVKR